MQALLTDQPIAKLLTTQKVFCFCSCYWLCCLGYAQEREGLRIIHIFIVTISSQDLLLKHFTPRNLLKKYGYSDALEIKSIKWQREKATYASNSHKIDLKSIFPFGCIQLIWQNWRAWRLPTTTQKIWASYYQIRDLG